jgi:hypothetical protein
MDITTSPPASATAERITFQITTLPPEALDRIRAQGYDDHGNRLRPTIDKEGGAPLRCCLRDSRPGERIMLLAWSPFHQASPYAEVGPVFIHTEPCGGYADQDAYPDGFRARRQVFRAYDTQGSIIDAILVEAGQDQEAAIATLLSRAEVAFIHSRNVLYGCYMFQIDRS